MIVKINDATSNEYLIPNGIPQGSHLGPILFIIFINSICSSIKHSKYWLFMDDLKFSYQIITPNDYLNLQEDINSVLKWAELNGMFLNMDKSVVISFTRSVFPLIADYYLNDSKLNRVNKIKDLGIVFDCKLSFNDHINFITCKANRTWGFIWRNTKFFKNWKSVRILYISLIRSILLYGSSVWRPYTKNKIKLFEKIQHRVVRQLAYLDGKPMSRFNHVYDEHNKNFDLPTLESMFKISDCIYLYKIRNGIINCEELKNKFTMNSYESIRHKTPFIVPKRGNNYASNEPIFRLSELGNILVKKNQVLYNFDVNLDIAISLIKKQFVSYVEIK